MYVSCYCTCSCGTLGGTSWGSSVRTITLWQLTWGQLISATVVKFTHKGISFEVLHVDPYMCRSVAKNFGCCTSVWVVFLRTFTSFRGYGGSDKPPQKSDYTVEVLKQDIAELVGETLTNNCARHWFQFSCCVQIPALGYEKCILVAHDWGGAIAW